MSMKINISLFIFTLLLVGSCRENPKKEVIIPNDFVKYVDRFIEEGAKRGHEIDFTDTGLLIEFRDAVDQESGGVCYLGQYHIQIEKFYWDDFNDIQKEGLIFHELGHCELGRLHRNDTLPNGEWASRMRGGDIAENASYVLNYSGTRREHYINELFDETVETPEWAYITADYNDYTDADKEELLRIETASDFEENLGVSTSFNFEIEFELFYGFSESWVGIQWGGRDNSNTIRIAFTGMKRFIIDSGNNVFGTMRDYPKLGALKSDFNKVTIRKIDDKYYVFLNEEFLYWFDFITPASSVVQSLVASTTDPEYRNITFSKLLK